MILTDLLCCFAPSPAESPSKVKQCVFCNPTSDRFDIVLQDADHVVFRDRSPAALHHLLAIPRRHIANVQSLAGSRGARTVHDMQAIGEKALSMVLRKEEEGNEFRFGFHIPPFRSVDHLHLHCLVLPFHSTIKSWKYRVAAGQPNATPPTSKGWGWFVTARQAIQILEGGGRIKVQAC